MYWPGCSLGGRLGNTDIPSKSRDTHSCPAPKSIFLWFKGMDCGSWCSNYGAIFHDIFQWWHRDKKSTPYPWFGHPACHDVSGSPRRQTPNRLGQNEEVSLPNHPSPKKIFIYYLMVSISIVLFNSLKNLIIWIRLDTILSLNLTPTTLGNSITTIIN